MDVDGVVEIEGRFLWFEYKGPGGTLGGGASRMFDALIASGPHTLVVIEAQGSNLADLIQGLALASTRGRLTVRADGHVRTIETHDIEGMLTMLCVAWCEDKLWDT